MLDGWCVGGVRCEGYLDTTSQQVDTWIYIFRRLVKCRKDFGWRQKKIRNLRIIIFRPLFSLLCFAFSGGGQILVTVLSNHHR